MSSIRMPNIEKEKNLQEVYFKKELIEFSLICNSLE